MESRVEKAAERKMCGYNCAQAVACTYCDLRELMKKRLGILLRDLR